MGVIRHVDAGYELADRSPRSAASASRCARRSTASPIRTGTSPTGGRVRASVSGRWTAEPGRRRRHRLRPCGRDGADRASAQRVATAGSPGPPRTGCCGSGSPRRSGPRPGGRPTAPATSGPGGATRRWRPAGRPGAGRRQPPRLGARRWRLRRAARRGLRASPPSRYLRAEGFRPARPIGVVNFGDEEGARFGVACAGSRLLTGALDADRARALRDGRLDDGRGHGRRGVDPEAVGADPVALQRIGTFVELHVEQGRGLVDLGAPVGVASAIWPHGRWRFDLPGEANHAGTTRLADRRDPMISLRRRRPRRPGGRRAARGARDLRQGPGRRRTGSTRSRRRSPPGWTPAVRSRPTSRAWSTTVAAARPTAAASARSPGPTRRSFDTRLRSRLSACSRDRIGASRVLATGAGHDAGILSVAWWRPRCSSSATRPGSRTRRRSSPRSRLRHRRRGAGRVICRARRHDGRTAVRASPGSPSTRPPSAWPATCGSSSTTAGSPR